MKGKIIGAVAGGIAGMGGLVAYLYSSKGGMPYTPNQGSSPNGQPIASGTETSLGNVTAGHTTYGNQTLGQDNIQNVDVSKIIESYKEGVISYPESHAVDLPSGDGHILFYLSDDCDFKKSSVQMTLAQLLYSEHKLSYLVAPVSKQWLTGVGLDKEIYSHACTRTIGVVDNTGKLLNVDDQSRAVFDAHMANAGAPYGALKHANVNLDDFIKQGIDILPIPLSLGTIASVMYGLTFVPSVGPYAAKGLDYLYKPYVFAYEYGNKALDKAGDYIDRAMGKIIENIHNSLSKFKKSLSPKK